MDSLLDAKIEDPAIKSAYLQIMTNILLKVSSVKIQDEAIEMLK